MIRITFGDNGGAGFEVAFQASLRDADMIIPNLPGAGSAGLFSGVLRTLLASTPSGAIRIQLARFRHPLGTRVVRFTIHLTLVTNSLVTYGIASSTLRVI